MWGKNSRGEFLATLPKSCARRGESLPPSVHFVGRYPLRLGAYAPKTPGFTRLQVQLW